MDKSIALLDFTGTQLKASALQVERGLFLRPCGRISSMSFRRRHRHHRRLLHRPLYGFLVKSCVQNAPVGSGGTGFCLLAAWAVRAHCFTTDSSVNVLQVRIYVGVVNVNYYFLGIVSGKGGMEVPKTHFSFLPISVRGVLLYGLFMMPEALVQQQQYV